MTGDKTEERPDRNDTPSYNLSPGVVPDVFDADMQCHVQMLPLRVNHGDVQSLRQARCSAFRSESRAPRMEPPRERYVIGEIGNS